MRNRNWGLLKIIEGIINTTTIKDLDLNQIVRQFISLCIVSPYCVSVQRLSRLGA